MNKYEKKYYKVVEEIKKGKRQSPLTAIRLHCLDCMGWQASEVAKCPSKDCIFYKFRSGRNRSGKRGL